MGTQYRCSNENRRDQVRLKMSGGAPNLNGIDYLDVISADEQTLSVVFIHSLSTFPPLSKSNFIIEGGARIQRITITKVDPPSGNVLTLHTSEAGDYSTYTLRLVVGDADHTRPPDRFDPQLAAVAFSFKIDCPSDFDCKPQNECLPEDLPAPLIDYLVKDYSSFRRLILDRLSTIMPEWRERNPADLQVALVEAVAYVADYLSYYQDAVATEAYLGTARQRISVRRHARLLDYRMHDGCNARVWVFLEAQADEVQIDPGTRLLTRGTADAAIVDPADYDQIVQQDRPIVFETLHKITLHEAHNTIAFYTWDDSECCLPKGATRATLDDSGPTLALKVGDVLIFEEVISPATGQPEDADPAHRHAVRLTEVTSGQDKLHDQNIVEIAWDTTDALPFSLCISAKVPGAAGPELKDRLSVARGNIVLADHGRTLPDEPLGNIGEDAAGRLIRPRLQNGPVTQQGHALDRWGNPVPDPEHSTEQALVDLTAPATFAFALNLRDTLPAVQLIENSDDSRPWLPRRDLLGSRRFQRQFVAETDNDGIAHLRFGDDFHGLKPKPDSTFAARYRVGNGTAGNVGADAICRVVLSSPAVKSVRNPFPASGGTEPEPIEQVRLYAPQAFRTQERAVTVDDYATIAERNPHVQKAAASLRWTGSWYTIFLTVDRAGGRLVDDPFKETMSQFIDRYRLAGEDTNIDAPCFVPLDIEVTVCVKPSYYRSQVKKDLLTLFGTGTLPNGRRGFFHPDNFTFGQPVYLSKIIEQAMQVPGVEWIDAEETASKPNRFRRWGQAPRGEFAAGKIGFGRLEIARLDNDPSLPENGKLDFFMEGGL